MIRSQAYTNLMGFYQSMPEWWHQEGFQVGKIGKNSGYNMYILILTEAFQIES